jgi:hypothetical protein
MNNIDTIIEAIHSLNLNLDLKADVDYLIYCYENEIIQIDYTILKIKNNMHFDGHDLYKNIVKIISEKCYSHNLLDMMPLIDEYIEYYLSL